MTPTVTKWERVKSEGWPVVRKDDNGIRPAGKPDECFYCHSKVGEPHGEECVCVTSIFRYAVYMNLDGPARERDKGKKVGTFQCHDPWHWSAHDAEFHKNDSSWCADNTLCHIHWDDAKDAEALEKWLGENKGHCSCTPLYFEFDKVVEKGPFIEVPDA